MYVIPETLKELAVPMGSVKRLPDDENPRIGDVPSMKESPEENTQYRPAVVNIREGTRYGDRTILAGNHTHQELEELGATEIAVTYVDVDDEAARKIVPADNLQGDLGTYDPEALAAAPQRMGDVEGTGYTPEFVERLLIGLGGPEPEGKADPDGLVEPPTTAVTKPGDLWVLGPHRVLCGESKNAEQLARLLEGAAPSMVFTDPPYGVDYVSRVDEGRREPWGAIANDHLKGEALRDLLRMTLGGVSCPMYVCCNWQSVVDFVPALGRPNATIVWDKESIGLGAGYRNQHEFVLFYGTIERSDETNVWRLGRDPSSGYDHPTQEAA